MCSCINRLLDIGEEKPTNINYYHRIELRGAALF